MLGMGLCLWWHLPPEGIRLQTPSCLIPALLLCSLCSKLLAFLSLRETLRNCLLGKRSFRGTMSRALCQRLC